MRKTKKTPKTAAQTNFTKAKLRELGKHPYFENKAKEAQKFVDSKGFREYLEKEKFRQREL